MTQVSVCQSQSKLHSVYPPFCRMGGGQLSQPNFKKGGGLDRTSTFTGCCWERGGGGDFFPGGLVQLSHNRLKSEIFDDKKSL